MEFEEFFKKKRIALDALQKAEPALFSEFESHFGQMGEKSFDHTKKYWFNKLRLRFPLAIEIKTEKPKIDNPLAEQTITESLIEQVAPTPKPGFVPKFKANLTKPVDGESKEDVTEAPALNPAPKPGFTPRFKAANMAGPSTEQAAATQPAETPVNSPAPKLSFTPKFKGTVRTEPAVEQLEEIERSDEIKPGTEKPGAIPNPKIGFTPRFKAANMAKPAADEPKEEAEPAKISTNIEADEPPVATAPKLGFTPKFKPKPMSEPKQEAPGESTDAPAKSEE